MKRSLKEAWVLLGFFIVFAVVFFFYGCATNKVICPSEDVVDFVLTPYGPIVLQTEKGRYSTEENHSLEGFLALDGWITLEEYRAWKAELQKEGTI